MTLLKIVRKRLFPLLFIIVLIGLDQCSKGWAVYMLRGKEDRVLIPGVLSFHYLENTGAAFSALEGATWVFLAITPVMIAGILWILFRLPAKRRFFPLRISCWFLLAGAVGNLIDRIGQGYVVDFIYFSLINFPVFNVADIYVTVSVFFIILMLLFYYREEDLGKIFPQRTDRKD